MAFPSTAKVASNTVFSFQGANQGKKIKFTVNQLAESVIIYMVQTIPGQSKPVIRLLDVDNTSVVFESDHGTFQMVAVLQYFSQQLPEGGSAITFGQNVSFDPAEPNSAGGEIFYGFEDRPLANTSIVPMIIPSAVIDFQDLPLNTIFEIAPPPGKYLNMGVVQPTSNSNGLLEGGVVVHIYDINRQDALLGVIRDRAKNNVDQGAPLENIENVFFDVSRNDHPDGLTFIALVEFKEENGAIVFDIGDPKRDASVEIEEV